MSSMGTSDGLTLTKIASGTVAEGKLVTYTGAQASVAGEKVLGVALYDAADGDVFAVAVAGVVHVLAGAAIGAGDALTVDATGRAVTAAAVTVAAGAVAVTSSAASGAILAGGILPQHAFGDALEAATAAGETIAVLMRR